MIRFCKKKVLVFGAAWHPSMVKRGGGTLGISQPSKRAKRKDMVSLKNVTDSALSAISKTLGRQSAGENNNQTMLSRMVHEEYQKFAWTISLPQDQGRDDFEWAFCKPDRLLQYFLDEAGGDFKNLLASTLDNCGAERLTLVFTADEVTPGDPLRPENFRQFWAIYFSFKEFGIHLYKEEVWMPVAVLRTHVSKHVVGQISHAFKRLLHIFA